MERYIYDITKNSFCQILLPNFSHAVSSNIYYNTHVVLELKSMNTYCYVLQTYYLPYVTSIMKS